MPRVIKAKKCPHCGEPFGDVTPRVCPACGGSLQQRYLKSGCISAGPALFLIGLFVFWAASQS